MDNNLQTNQEQQADQELGVGDFNSDLGAYEVKGGSAYTKDMGEVFCRDGKTYVEGDFHSENRADWINEHSR